MSPSPLAARCAFDSDRVLLCVSHRVYSKNNVRRIRGLITAGVPATSHDYDLRTALHLACSEGHLEAARLLLEQGADPNAKDRFGSTPLDDAIRGDYTDVVAALREYGATPGGLQRLQAQLIEACAKGEVATVQKLLHKDLEGKLVPHSAGISPNWYENTKKKRKKKNSQLRKKAASTLQRCPRCAPTPRHGALCTPPGTDRSNRHRCMTSTKLKCLFCIAFFYAAATTISALPCTSLLLRVIAISFVSFL
jgi:hypothetical protein